MESSPIHYVENAQENKKKKQFYYITDKAENNQKRKINRSKSSMCVVCVSGCWIVFG